MDAPAQQLIGSFATQREGTQRLANADQQFLPVLISPQHCALAALVAARTAAALGASPDDVALAVAHAVQAVGTDAARLGLPGPTSAPSAPTPVPASSDPEMAFMHPDFISSDASGLSDASAVTSTNASSHEIASTEQSSYASSELFDVSSNSLDASVSDKCYASTAPLLSKRQRRRQRQRLQRRPPEPTTAPTSAAPTSASPPHYDLTRDDTDAEQLEEIKDRTPSDCNIQTENVPVCEFIVPHRRRYLHQYVCPNPSCIPSTCEDFQSQVGLDSCFPPQLEDGRTLSDYYNQKDNNQNSIIINDLPGDSIITNDMPGNYHSDYNIQNGFILDHSVQNLYENFYQKGRLIQDLLSDYNIQKGYVHGTLDCKVDDEDGRTLSDYSVQRSNESHESDENSLANNHEPSFSHESHSRCIDLESKQPEDGRTHSDHSIQSASFNESHERDEDSLATTFSDHSIHVNNPGASFIQPAVPPVVSSDGVDPGAASRCSWCSPAVPPRLAAHGPVYPAHSELEELTERAEVLKCMIAGTMSVPSSRFRDTEFARLHTELSSTYLAIDTYQNKADPNPRPRLVVSQGFS